MPSLYTFPEKIGKRKECSLILVSCESRSREKELGLSSLFRSDGHECVPLRNPSREPAAGK